MAKAKDLTFGLRLDSQEFDKGLDKAKDKVDGVAKKSTGMFGSIGKGLGKVSGGIGKWGAGLGAAIVSPLGAALAAGAVAGAITTGITSSFTKGIEDAALDKKLNMMLSGMGQGAKMPQILDLANNMEKAFGIDDNEVKKGFEVMLQNGLGAAEIKGLSGLAADIHKATGEEFSEVSRDLAEAAQGEVTVLEKYGIWYEKTGDRVKDAAAAMKLLQDRFKGQGAAMSGSLDPFKQLQTTFSNLQETIGKKLMPYVSMFASKLATWVEKITASGELEVWMDTIIMTIQDIWNGITTGITFVSNAINTAVDFWIELWNSKLMPVVNYAVGFFKDIFTGLTNGNFFATVWEMFKLYAGLAFELVTKLVPMVGQIVFNTVKSAGGMIAGWLLEKFGWLLPDNIKAKAQEMAASMSDTEIVTPEMKESLGDFSESVQGRVQETREKIRQQNGQTGPINDEQVFGKIDPIDRTQQAQPTGPTAQQQAQQFIYGAANTNVTTKFSRDETAKFRAEEAKKRKEELAKLQGDKPPVIRMYGPQQMRLVTKR